MLSLLLEQNKEILRRIDKLEEVKVKKKKDIDIPNDVRVRCYFGNS